MGNIFGEIFRVATFGESHGPAIGCVIDGCPAGLALEAADFAADMARRAPGNSTYASPRKEPDTVEILSGTFGGVTTGAPIALLIHNRDRRPDDYDNLARVLRPGHGDFTYMAKYGIRDHRGGGRASARETAARAAAGVVAKKILAQLKIEIAARVAAIGHIEIARGEDFAQNKAAAALIEDCMAAGDSIGSAIICEICGLPPGIGVPVFDKLSADLAKALMSIGGAAGIEFGAGFAAATRRASENNDGFIWQGGEICKTANNAGGIMAGISDGAKIRIKLGFKPPSSIAATQNTATTDGQNTEIAIKGRHDPVIAPRACVVAEAMAAIVLVNHIFRGLSDTMDKVKAAIANFPPYAKQ
ncbi:MAG: chorismate synthase [Clostridiales bacterium]|jgi:chorismate synthase|nr:chorismate synthase [Clostridiales bacterium]